jgi:hypothetical protein
MLLVITLPIGALMVAVLRGEYNATQVQSSVQQVVVDTQGNDTVVDIAKVSWQELWDMQDPQLLSELGLTQQEFAIQHNLFVDEMLQRQYLVDANGNAYIEQNSTQSRAWFQAGSEVRGPYSPTDITGVQYLFNEMKKYLWLSVDAAAWALIYGAAAILCGFSVVGAPAAVVLGSLSILLAGLSGKLGSISDAANNAALTAIRIMESGRWYKVARNWNWLGIITGYDAWAV